MSPLAEELRHDHDHGVAHAQHEEKTRWVVVLTAGMMVGELIFGQITGSLALTADGWHMATHVGALGLGSLAYWFARTRSRESVFSFGTGKVHALAGYTSAIILAIIALWMFYESGDRLLHPMAIDFRDALGVAGLGLLVNLVSAKLLHVGHGHGHGEAHGHAHGEEHGHAHAHGHAEAHGHAHGEAHEHAHGEAHEHAHEEAHGHAHDHDHDHGHGHGHGHHVDHNLRASYVHVLADAFTSVLTILALLGGRYMGWQRLDPVVGFIGGFVILRWSLGLCRDAAKQLLDMVPSTELEARIREGLEAMPGTQVVDLHVWQIGPGASACLASVISEEKRSPLDYASELKKRERLAHVTVEVHHARERAQA